MSHPQPDAGASASAAVGSSSASPPGASVRADSAASSSSGPGMPGGVAPANVGGAEASSTRDVKAVSPPATHRQLPATSSARASPARSRYAFASASDAGPAESNGGDGSVYGSNSLSASFDVVPPSEPMASSSEWSSSSGDSDELGAVAADAGSGGTAMHSQHFGSAPSSASAVASSTPPSSDLPGRSDSALEAERQRRAALEKSRQERLRAAAAARRKAPTAALGVGEASASNSAAASQNASPAKDARGYLLNASSSSADHVHDNALEGEGEQQKEDFTASESMFHRIMRDHYASAARRGWQGEHQEQERKEHQEEHILTSAALAKHTAAFARDHGDDDDESSSGSWRGRRHVAHGGKASQDYCSCDSTASSSSPTNSDDEYSICTCSLATDSSSEFGSDCSDCSSEELLDNLDLQHYATLFRNTAKILPGMCLGFATSALVAAMFKALCLATGMTYGDAKLSSATEPTVELDDYLHRVNQATDAMKRASRNAQKAAKDQKALQATQVKQAPASAATPARK